MARILRPKGRVIMNVPFYYWIHEETVRFLPVHRVCAEKIRDLVRFLGGVADAAGGSSGDGCGHRVQDLSRAPASQRDERRRCAGVRCAFLRTRFGRRSRARPATAVFLWATLMKWWRSEAPSRFLAAGGRDHVAVYVEIRRAIAACEKASSAWRRAEAPETSSPGLILEQRAGRGGPRERVWILGSHE